MQNKVLISDGPYFLIHDIAKYFSDNGADVYIICDRLSSVIRHKLLMFGRHSNNIRLIHIGSVKRTEYKKFKFINYDRYKRSLKYFSATRFINVKELQKIITQTIASNVESITLSDHIVFCVSWNNVQLSSLLLAELGSRAQASTTIFMENGQIRPNKIFVDKKGFNIDSQYFLKKDTHDKKNKVSNVIKYRKIRVPKLILKLSRLVDVVEFNKINNLIYVNDFKTKLKTIMRGILKTNLNQKHTLLTNSDLNKKILLAGQIDSDTQNLFYSANEDWSNLVDSALLLLKEGYVDEVYFKPHPLSTCRPDLPSEFKVISQYENINVNDFYMLFTKNSSISLSFFEKHIPVFFSSQTEFANEHNHLSTLLSSIYSDKLSECIARNIRSNYQEWLMINAHLLPCQLSPDIAETNELLASKLYDEYINFISQY